MAYGLIDLYEAGFKRQWLRAADQLVQRMIDDFWDDADGGFFYTSVRHRDVLVRYKPFDDAAVPSGNSTAAAVLLRLGRLLGNRDYLDKGERILRIAATMLRNQAPAHWDLLCALDRLLFPEVEIAIVGALDDRQTQTLLQTIHSRFLPNKVVALCEHQHDQPSIDIPLLRDKAMIDNRPTVYVCEQSGCKPPVARADMLDALLSRVTGQRAPEGKVGCFGETVATRQAVSAIV